MDEIRVNGSGANDPTAYTAILRTEGSGATCDVAEGEIWVVETQAGFEKTELVVAVNDNIVSCLTLVENDKTPNAINADVDGRTLYSNAAMLHFNYANNMRRKMGEITAQKLRRVREKIAEVVGIPNIRQEMARSNRLEGEVEELKAKLEKGSAECTSIECRRDIRKETEERLRCEFLLEERDLTIDMLKRQIESLQERIIDGELQRL